jgi:hypothetical protein
MSRDAPIAVLQAAINLVVEGIHDKQKVADELQDFISSNKFAGAKPGYFFSKGDKGVGYVQSCLHNTMRIVCVFIRCRGAHLGCKCARELCTN